jgi:hypothetical protein
VKSCLNAEDPVNDFYAKRGLIKETIDKYELRIDGKWAVIPYLDEHGTEIAWIARSLSDQEPKYLYASGKPRHLYNFGLLKNKQSLPYLYISEGEIDCLTLLQAGFHAVGANASTFKEDWADLIAYRGPNRVYIAYDGDEPGRTGSRRVATALQAAYRKAGKPLDVGILILPNGKDINDLYLASRDTFTETIQTLIDTAIPYPLPVDKPVNLQDKPQNVSWDDLKGVLGSTGFIHDYMEYAREITDAPSVFHLFCGYHTLGTTLSRSIYFQMGEQKIRTNLYIAILAESSLSRKSTALGIAEGIISDVDADLLLPHEITPEALVASLDNRQEPTGTFMLSEFGSLLGSMKKDYMTGFREILTNLYDCPPLYCRKTCKDNFEVHNPIISILAASTLAWLVDRIDRKDLESGFLTRFLWIPALPKETIMSIPPPADESKRRLLVASLNTLREIQGEMTLSEEAHSLYDHWYGSYEREASTMEEGRDILGPFYSRLSVYGIKFAMLNEVATSRKLVISEQSMAKALTTIDFLKGELKRLYTEELVFGKFAQIKNRVLKRIKQTGKISRSDLSRAIQISSRTLDSVIKTLLEEDHIDQDEEATRTKKRIIYVYLG